MMEEDWHYKIIMESMLIRGVVTTVGMLVLAFCMAYVEWGWK